MVANFALSSTVYREESQQRSALLANINDTKRVMWAEERALDTLEDSNQGQSAAAQSLRTQIGVQEQQIQALQEQARPLQELDNDVAITCVAAGLILATTLQLGRMGIRKLWGSRHKNQ